MKYLSMPLCNNLLLTLVTSLFLFSCQQDDAKLTETENLGNTKKRSTTRIVEASEIPEVIDFLQAKSTGELKFKLESSNALRRNHEEDLIITSVLTDQIKQAINDFGKSNYTFKLKEQEDKNGIYFMNLVVKEYKETFYLYIVNYVPNMEWYKSNNGEMSMSDFTGDIYFYNESGYFLGQAVMIEGRSVSIQGRDCADIDDNEDPWEGDTWGDGGEGGNGAGGGSDCTIIVSMGSSSGTSCSSGCDGDLVGDHDHDATDGDSWVNVEVVCGGQQRSAGSDLFNRDPCPSGSGSGGYDGPDCSNSAASCDFPMAFDTNCNCVEAEQVENNEVGISPDPKVFVLLDYILTPDLTSNQRAWIELNSSNEKFATAIYHHFGSQEGFAGNLSLEDQVVAQKVLDIFMGLSDTEVLSSEYEHEIFTAIVGRAITATQPVLFEEHEEAYSNIDPDNVLSLSDMALISEKVWENGLLVLALPPAILFNQNELVVSISTQIVENDSFIAMLAHVKSLVGEHWPQNVEEYEAIGTFMLQFMGEVGLAFIPGSGIIDAFQAAEEDDYLMVTFALATVIADFFGGTIIKVVAKIGKVGYKSFKIFRLAYNYLENIASGIAENIIEALLDQNTVKILSGTGDELARILDEVMEISYHNIKAVNNSVIFRTADEANEMMAIRGYTDPPFSNVVTQFVTSETEQFVRFHNSSNPNRSWMMKLSDVQNLSNLNEVRNLYSLNLDNAITHVSTITVPNNTAVFSGYANGLYNFDGGGYQFFIDELVDLTWVTNTQSIFDFFN